LTGCDEEKTSCQPFTVNQANPTGPLPVRARHESQVADEALKQTFALRVRRFANFLLY
jgi:hypothetical protein